MNGHNVRLAAKLTGYKIDVKTEEEDAKANSFSSNLADKLEENDFVFDDFDFEDEEDNNDNIENEEAVNKEEFSNDDFELDFDDEK